MERAIYLKKKKSKKEEREQQKKTHKTLKYKEIFLGVEKSVFNQ